MFEKLKKALKPETEPKKKEIEKSSLADYFNIVYADIYNIEKIDFDKTHSKEVLSTKDYIFTVYPELNSIVLEFLSTMKCIYPKSKIQFLKSKMNEGQSIALTCKLDEKDIRLIIYDYNGRTLFDSNVDGYLKCSQVENIKEPAQKGE